MGYSSLAKNMKISQHYTTGREGAKINKIVIHHMAGVLTAQQCTNVWTNREASAHYCIGSDGVIGCAVDENNTAWACGDWDANISSISIEFSNSVYGGDWKVADKTIQLGIKLIADIAKRNKLGKLVKGKNLCWHSMFCFYCLSW